MSLLGGLEQIPRKVHALRLNLMLFKAQYCYAKDRTLGKCAVREILLTVHMCT